MARGARRRLSSGPPTDTEDVSAAIVTFESGAVATVLNSLVSPRETSSLRFDFEHATVELEHLYGYGDDDWRSTAAPGREDLGEAWRASDAASEVRSGHAAQFTAIFDALDAGLPAPVGFDDARQTIDLVASIYASAFEDRTVARGSIDADDPLLVDARHRGPVAERSPLMSITVTHELDSHVVIRDGDVELARYTYRPDTVQLESPKPYLHPLRTRGGDPVTLFRPHDHVWHKGIAWSLPHVGDENFWGGPTYVHGQFYVQLENNGRAEHERMTELEATADAATIAHRLRWITQGGRQIIEEDRRIGAHLVDDAWARLRDRDAQHLGRDHLHRIAHDEGRENAGYGGLFWRGRARSPEAPSAHPSVTAAMSCADPGSSGWGSRVDRMDLAAPPPS